MESGPNTQSNVPNVKIVAGREHLARISKKAETFVVIFLQTKNREIHLDACYRPDTPAQGRRVRPIAHRAQRAGFEAPDAARTARIIILKERQLFKIAVPVAVSDITPKVQDESPNELPVSTSAKGEFVIFQITSRKADFCRDPSIESASREEDAVPGVLGESGREIEIKIIRMSINK